MIKLLDCTLREAPVENFFIGEKFIKEFVYRCEKVGIDVIECGFLKDVDHVPGSNCFRTVEQIREYIPNKKVGITYVALMDYGRYSLENLSEYDGTSIDGIRICFKYGQQKEAIETGKQIKAKGYKVFIQHVDTLAYTDIEIINFIDQVNELKPDSYAIVDTFGSMYADDLIRLSMLINHHLDKDITLGFHPHNNLLLANSNIQEFISRYAGKREIMVDASVLGCGRGAGNANTELVTEFLNKKYNRNYDLNELLDLVDRLMPKLQEHCSWGYSIPYFLSGIHGAHVYNANFLLRRHNIPSKDLRAIIEKLDGRQKKEYDYALLERLYVEHFDHPIDDKAAKSMLKKQFEGRKILLLAPGMTLKTERDKINEFIETEHPLVIGINNKISIIKLDYIFFSSRNRYSEYCFEKHKSNPRLLLTSNIMQSTKKTDELVFDYKKLIKFGWVNIDSSMILLLRLVLELGCKEVYIAGFDGFTANRSQNYYLQDLETSMKIEDLLLLTEENRQMLDDLEMHYSDAHIVFLTTSQYTNKKGKSDEKV